MVYSVLEHHFQAIHSQTSFPQSSIMTIQMTKTGIVVYVLESSYYSKCHSGSGYFCKIKQKCVLYNIIVGKCDITKYKF